MFSYKIYVFAFVRDSKEKVSITKAFIADEDNMAWAMAMQFRSQIGPQSPKQVILLHSELVPDRCRDSLITLLHKFESDHSHP